MITQNEAQSLRVKIPLLPENVPRNPQEPLRG